jgi:hypothetical protein
LAIEENKNHTSSLSGITGGVDHGSPLTAVGELSRCFWLGEISLWQAAQSEGLLWLKRELEAENHNCIVIIVL